MDDFQNFVAVSKYCRWLENENRRETWDECVDRYFDYMEARFCIQLGSIRNAVKDREIFPSMRGLMTAGPAADKDDTCLYNCSYIAMDKVSSFSDLMYILCCGTGAGFSCEKQCIDKLPCIPDEIVRTDDIIVVQDTRQSWAESFRELLEALYSGSHPTWDTSLIRPAGQRLKTFGGRSSGPEPLERLFKFVVGIFNGAVGRKLTSLEVHDIVCMTGEIVIAGGVRRSALISLSDLHDREMSMAKSGPWWETSTHRSLANNSAVYETKPDLGTFLDEWTTIYNSKSGERGICNRESLTMLAEKSGRDTNYSFGTNPCSEIILRPNQFCNLSEVVIREDDTLESLAIKVKMASILGTIQSACTNFTYLNSDWTDNCEDERLLGVSFTGIYDNKLMSGALGMPKLRWTLQQLKEAAQETNIEWAHKLGISESKAITCCKPSGTTSCVAGTSSGLHPRYSEFYIRRVRIDKKDPICCFMIDNGIPCEDDKQRPDLTAVFSFPMKAPIGSLVQGDHHPIDHLNLWLEYQTHWCDHKPSVTVSYTDDTFLAIGQWLWDNWHYASGISFLPFTDHIYDQAPFEAIDARTYNLLSGQMPKSIDWNLLSDYESEDNTEDSPTLACSGGSCEVVDLVENTNATA